MGLHEVSAMIGTCLAVIVLETIAGIVTSMYVVIIIMFDFYRRKNMRTGNKIRVALSISNMLFSIVTSVGVFSGFFWPWISKATSTTCILFALLIYTISSCSWLSAGLSFFYFIKIVPLKADFFLWVKMKISLVVSGIILVSEVVSLGGFFIILLPNLQHGISHESSNSTEMISCMNPTSGNMIKTRFAFMIVIVTLVPLLSVIFTSIYTAMVLKQHRVKMEKNMGFSGNLTIYQNATYRMLRLLFFFILFYVITLLFYMSEFSELSPGFWICIIILSSFTAIQSILLVLGNQKLKSAWRELLHCNTDTKQVNSST